MSPAPAASSARSLEVINADIRTLWAGRTEPRLTPIERDRYHQLLVEYAEAVRAVTVLAA
ncbi:hypothetical protein [Streptomyces tremellae]|uniref:Uncharacterized protein n=1 Tax=Streptomyces tremellae TaxID=1124239 RepID=A0ABP7EFA4_9ACTN